MGAARLRIAAFPVIGKGADAHDWDVPVELMASASHCFGGDRGDDVPAELMASAPHCFDGDRGDTVEALNDNDNNGLEPSSSSDYSIPRFTWWPHKGTAEWVQYDFKKPWPISAVEVYWFDDTGKGSCRVPQSWELLYKDGDAWKPVAGATEYGVKPDTFNRVTFPPVTASALRLEVQLQPNVSGGILEWRVKYNRSNG
jgi:hypothetical protein